MLKLHRLARLDLLGVVGELGSEALLHLGKDLGYARLANAQLGADARLRPAAHAQLPRSLLQLQIFLPVSFRAHLPSKRVSQ